MKTNAIIRSLLILAFSGSLLLAESKPENDALKAAEQWLSIIDASSYGESWKNTAALFQKEVSQEMFVNQLGTVRKPLGEFLSRKLGGAKYTPPLPGAPDGEYVVLQFETSFANKKTAIETVTPMLEKDGQWKVSGYYVK